MEIRRGEVWLADLGQPSGSEQGGVRPIIVVQNNVGNVKSPTVITVPLTTQKKACLPTQGTVRPGRSGLRTASTFMAEQIRTLDKRSLKFRYGTLTPSEMAAVDVALAVSIQIIALDRGPYASQPAS